MTDRRKKDRPDLVVPDKGIVSVDEAQAERRRPRPPGDFMKSYVSREEMLEDMAKVALAIGQKVYDQIAGESQVFLQEMETALRAELHRELEARSLRGRLRAWWQRVTCMPKPALVVDAVDALDPNVHAAATEELDATLEDEIMEQRS